jgi:hypothetical protein
MMVYELTPQQANEIRGKEYIDSAYFNPIQDNNNTWIISIEEVDYCRNPIFMWVKELPMIPYEPKINEE